MIKLLAASVDHMIDNWYKEKQIMPYNILFLVTHGQLNYTVNNQTYRLLKGDFVFVPQRTVRTAVNDSQGPHQKYYVLFHTEPSFAQQLPTRYCKVNTHNFEYIRQRFITLYQHWLGQLPHYEKICQGILLELLGHLARENDMEHHASTKVRMTKQVQEYIIQHYRSKIVIGDLAQLVHRTPNYVTQTFKEVTGLTPLTYIHHLRIQKARDLLLNSKSTIREISEYLGYSDHPHFHRMFKKITGQIPSEIGQHD